MNVKEKTDIVIKALESLIGHDDAPIGEIHDAVTHIESRTSGLLHEAIERREEKERS
jgi:hypothetical protein